MFPLHPSLPSIVYSGAIQQLNREWVRIYGKKLKKAVPLLRQSRNSSMPIFLSYSGLRLPVAACGWAHARASVLQSTYRKNTKFRERGWIPDVSSFMSPSSEACFARIFQWPTSSRMGTQQGSLFFVPYVCFKQFFHLLVSCIGE